ncbi:MAG: PP2C family protein-serine/threonine phosphatase [Gemmataceae bacterium]
MLRSAIENLSPDWRAQLAYIVEAMREMSRQTDPQEMGKLYGKRMRGLMPLDASLSVSRRDLDSPLYRVTRSSRWAEDINPWKQRDKLPLLSGGVLAELLYGDQPHLFDDFSAPPGDPAFEYLDGFRSVAAVPMYDKGASLNMILLMRKEPGAFNPEQFPSLVWQSNLYGRATHNLVLSEQLKDAYNAVDHELKVVAGIQRSLLPTHAPAIPGVGIATYYQTSQRAGGDYYDFFPLPDGRWGILIADVSGHGTPAAVIMAITHSLAHTFPGPHDRPGRLLEYLNDRLHGRYTLDSTFVTAFHAIYDPATRALTYASAGHNPPRLKRCDDGSLAQLDAVAGLPLGIFGGEAYEDATMTLVRGDQLILYTDGVTEAHDPAGKLFGLERLDRVLENCSVGADDILRSVLDEVAAFTAGRPAHDDRTLLILKIA